MVAHQKEFARIVTHYKLDKGATVSFERTATRIAINRGQSLSTRKSGIHVVPGVPVEQKLGRRERSWVSGSITHRPETSVRPAVNGLWVDTKWGAPDVAVADIRTPLLMHMIHTGCTPDRPKNCRCI